MSFLNVFASRDLLRNRKSSIIGISDIYSMTNSPLQFSDSSQCTVRRWWRAWRSAPLCLQTSCGTCFRGAASVDCSEASAAASVRTDCRGSTCRIAPTEAYAASAAAAAAPDRTASYACPRCRRDAAVRSPARPPSSRTSARTVSPSCPRVCPGVAAASSALAPPQSSRIASSSYRSPTVSEGAARTNPTRRCCLWCLPASAVRWRWTSVAV